MAQKSEARWGQEDGVQMCKSARGLCKIAKVKPDFRVRSAEYRVLRGQAGKGTRRHGGGGTEAQKAKGRERR
jgi:hypothetical protein